MGCGKGGEALDYAPPACTDLAPYRLGDMLSKCDDSVEAYAVVAGQCERLDGCSHALNAFATRSECESKCMEGTLCARGQPNGFAFAAPLHCWLAACRYLYGRLPQSAFCVIEL